MLHVDNCTLIPEESFFSQITWTMSLINFRREITDFRGKDGGFEGLIMSLFLFADILCKLVSCSFGVWSDIISCYVEQWK